MNHFPSGDVEQFKLEKKRERNRIAATKCRLRKMERISQLDGQVIVILKVNQAHKLIPPKPHKLVNQAHLQVQPKISRWRNCRWKIGGLELRVRSSGKR